MIIHGFQFFSDPNVRENKIAETSKNTINIYTDLPMNKPEDYIEVFMDIVMKIMHPGIFNLYHLSFSMVVINHGRSKKLYPINSKKYNNAEKLKRYLCRKMTKNDPACLLLLELE